MTHLAGRREHNGDSDLEGYQMLFDSMPCIVSVQDRDFKLIKVNRNFEIEFGSRIGEHCFRVYKGLHSICPNCSVRKTFLDGKVHHSEESVIKRGGTEATILVTTSPVFDSENNVIAAVEMSQDVTEFRNLQAQLRTSEERYRALFNNQANPIFVVSLRDLSILDANDRALAEYGHSRHQLLGMNFLGLALKKERQRVNRAIRHREGQILKVQHLQREGSVIWTNIRISYSQYESQDVAIVTASDITDWLKAEQQLAQTFKLATLGEMSTGVAHELNQPLSVIKSASTFLSFLTKKVIDKTSPDAREGSPEVRIRADVLKPLAEEINSHVDRASRIIQHLREFGRKSDLAKEHVDINECIEGAFMMLGRQLEVRGIAAHLQLGAKLPTILADRNRIEQVFINLILNARDAIEEKQKQGADDQGAMALWLRSYVRLDQVVVTFRDNGCGIPEDIQTQIFDPFFTTKEVGKGTGLGLSISYGIIQDYAGSIQVESALNKGTTFTISFPAVKEDRSGSGLKKGT
jgi:histidine kinase